MKKRLFAALAALAMLTAWIPAMPAFAASAKLSASTTTTHTVQVHANGAAGRNVTADEAEQPYSKQYYYEQLDAVSKAVYDAILASSLGQGPSTQKITISLLGVPLQERTFKASFTVTKGRNGTADKTDSAECFQFCQSAIDPALTALMFDHSELSWLRNTEYGCAVAWSTDVKYNLAGMQPGETRVFDNYTLVCTSLDFEVTPLGYAWSTVGWETQSGPERYNYADTGNLAQIMQAIMAAKTEIGDLSDLSVPEKIQIIHDWVCGSVEYADKSSELFINEWRGYQTAFSALIEGTTVCAGYCAAFKLLCDEYDIPCVIVRGVDAEGDAHVWNYVQVDKDWYGVDCTWDDTYQQPIYDYFLRGSDSFLGAGTSGYHEERLLFDPYPFSYPVLTQLDYPGVTRAGVASSEAPGSATDPAPSIPPPAAPPAPAVLPSAAADTAPPMWPPLRRSEDAVLDFEVVEAAGAKSASLTGLKAAKGTGGTNVEQLMRSISVPDEMYVRVAGPDGVEMKPSALVASGQRVQVLRSQDAAVVWEAGIVVRGDVLGTGRLTLTQLVQMGRQLTRHTGLEGPYLAAADLTEDGRFTISDVVLAARSLAGTGQRTP